ncbi:MAG: HAD-IIB family hydrolase [Chitinophagaceae bacterium]|nr:MAG: HAD-IIB family hydrolase [Chitinophagaceae bacterium]
MVLATDLDGTFLGGKELQRQQLYRLIKESVDARLIFVTGRGLESVVPLLNDPQIPNPHYIICDVGATIVDGHTLQPVGSLQAEIEKRWPGSDRVIARLSEIEGLSYQQVPQQRRCSFFTDSVSVIREVRLTAAAMDCEVIYSAGKFLDVLPGGVNKGSSLYQLVKYLGMDVDEVLVAGDTLNDLAMYQYGFKGVVVGNAEQKLVNATAELEEIYYAEENGAGGIMEALFHYTGLSGKLRKSFIENTAAGK